MRISKTITQLKEIKIIYQLTSTFYGFERLLIESIGLELPVIALNTPFFRVILEKKLIFPDFSEFPEDIFLQIQHMISNERYIESDISSLYRSGLF